MVFVYYCYGCDRQRFVNGTEVDKGAPKHFVIVDLRGQITRQARIKHTATCLNDN